jgi:hypothetical protein
MLKNKNLKIFGKPEKPLLMNNFDDSAVLVYNILSRAGSSVG